MTVWKLIMEDAEAGARALVSEYGARLYATAFRICLNEADAEDLVQRTLVRVVASASTFNGRSTFFTWMCSILINFRRMDLRRKGANALVFPEEVPEAAEKSASPDESLAKEDEAALLRKIVAKLPEDLRTSIILFYFNGLSVPEISKAVKIPEGTVYYRLHEARMKIRDKIAKYFPHRSISKAEGKK